MTPSARCQHCGVELSGTAASCPGCGRVLADSPTTDSLVGRLVAGKYRLLRRLGQGGMGVVYLAEHAGVGQKVAIKFLHPTFSADPEISRRFHNEARSYARVVHPHAIQLHDFGQDEQGGLFISMEYVEGSDLRRVLSQGPLPPREALDIVLQVADVLSAAHASGIVHRDLKPENIMLAREIRGWHAKVLDFGLAQLADGGGRLTTPGAVSGTPRYMAPEQVEGQPLDHRVDIYALGLVLFEALTGKSPFDSQSISELMRLQLSVPVPRLSQAAPHLAIDPSVDLAIQTATAKRREERFARMADFAQALSSALARLGPAPVTSSMPAEDESGPTLARIAPTPRSQASAPSPKNATRAWALAAALGVLVSAGAFWAWRSSATERAAADRHRREIDEAFVLRREPPPPANCREKSLELLKNLAAASRGDASALEAVRAHEGDSAEAAYLVSRAAFDKGAREGHVGSAALACSGFAAAENLAGNYALLHGALEEAEKRYQAALADAPGFLSPKSNLALLRFQQGRDEEAFALIRQVLAAQPDDPKAHFTLGMLHERMAATEARRGSSEAASREAEAANAAFCRALDLGDARARGRCRR